MRATSTYSSKPAQLRQLLGDIAMHANALQTDGVQHARRCLDDTLGWMSFARLQEEAFGDDGAER
jgi:hypothetical protein